MIWTVPEIQAGWDDDVVVMRVVGNRHVIQYKDNRVELTFCNYCGGTLIRKGKCTGCGVSAE